MKTAFRLAPVIAALSLLMAAGPASAAQRYDTPVSVPSGTVLLTSVELSRSETEDGVVTTTQVQARYRDTVTVREDGFHVARRLVDKQITGRATAEMLLMFLDALEFDTDPYLLPVAIDDWPAILDRAYAGFPPVQGRAMVGDLVAQFSKAPSSQAARSLLSYDNLLSLMQGQEYVLGKPVNYVNSGPNPMGGSPIKVNGTIAVESIDRKAGLAVITMRESLDPEAAQQSIGQVLVGMSQRLGQNLTADDLKIERTTDCRYEMDLANGLTRRVECLSTTLVVAGKSSVKRVDRRTVTRTLEAKP